MRSIALFLFTVFLTVSLVVAQDTDCATLTQQFIDAARKACADIGYNQACYGNGALEVEPREQVRIDFSKPGDIADLAALKSLITRPFDARAQSWGVAFLRVRADLPNNALTLIALGEVTLQNDSDASNDFIALTITVKEVTGANVRAQPSPDAPLIQTLNTGDEVKAIGRLADGSWIRLPEGWVSAELVKSATDLSLLKILKPDDPIPGSIYGPMQALHFRSGLDDAPCVGASDSGLLAQTPDGVSNVTLVVNGAALNLSGTAWLQTTVEGQTVLTVLEGQVNYGAESLAAGEMLRYGYQGDIIEYTGVEPYHYARARYLPVQLLSREFELLFSLGGLIFPFTPGTGFLSGIAPDATCTVAWTVDVNLRAGPGTDYPIRQGVAAGYYAHPDARGQGSDGGLWWRLTPGVWVAANITAAAGGCGDLPLADK